MKTKRLVAILMVIGAATLMQGCALVYVQDSNANETCRVREVGLLGGCIPLFSIRTSPSAKSKVADEKNVAPDKQAENRDPY